MPSTTDKTAEPTETSEATEAPQTPKAEKAPKTPKAPKPARAPKEAKPAKAPKAAKPAKAAAARDLTKELGALLSKSILPDLRTRVRDEPEVRIAMARQHEAERKAQRTADDFDAWIDRTLEQIGVAWVLSLVFLRTLEDRGLLDHARLAGPGALDSEGVFFELFPSLGVGDYLYASFRELSRLPGAREVFAPKHNPAWRLSPSGPVLRELVAFFREAEPASGEGGEPRLVWRFDGSDTRFLGDLYQDVSASVRERYALLQTPDFVEALILDQTLTPAIAEYGLEAVRVLDPTCGSGHFLLGAFRRLFEARQRAFPASPAKEQAGKALERVYGTDINPYAVAIARFRLLLAYLEAAGIDRLRDAPELPANLVVVDSLAYGAEGASLALDFGAEALESASPFAFRLDDAEGAKRVLGRRFHAVIGNPPYITCKDPALRELYRKGYASATKQFALAAPFTEAFFRYALDGAFVGLINANSFMKREFGKALVEQVLPQFELTRVVDTSGAYIPGHGTPTVLLFGRNRRPLSATVRAVLGKRGEPSTPEKPEEGLVWSSLRDHLDDVGFENDYLSVAELPRATFDKHPWSLGGGGAGELKELLEARAERRLGEIAKSIGFASFTGLDELFIRPTDAFLRAGVPATLVRPMVIGESIRDWSCDAEESALTPYDLERQEPIVLELASRWHHTLWPWRRVAETVASFGGKDRKEEGQNWWEWYRWQVDRYRTPLSIAFAEVATHNHFVLDRGGKVFKQTAPIIKLPEGATEDEHLALVAYLNSSTACFWMKQVCHNKTNASQKHTTDPARATHAFSSTAISPLPIPGLSTTLTELARRLDETCRERTAAKAGSGAIERWAAATNSADVQRAVSDAWRDYDELTARAAYLQEEIDWEVYRAFGLTDAQPSSLEGRCALGARPFERGIGYDPGVSAKVRREEVAAVDTEATALWPERELLCRQPPLALLEDRAFKRMWRDTEHNVDQADFREQCAREWVENHLLAELEQATKVSAETRIESARALGQRLSQRVANLEVIAEWLGTEPTSVVEDLLARDAVPYLAALRYTDAGLDKRAQWERTWKLQRDEDAGLAVGKIPVPPKYDQKDYRDASYWRLRGKLDVPKERFIAYPGAESDDDTSPLYGWAGWDHLQQATALAALYHERKVNTGWGADEAGRARLVPLLAGLLELVPWIQQWHAEPHDDFGGESPGDWYARYVEAEARSLGKSVDELRAWRPEAKKGGRKKG